MADNNLNHLYPDFRAKVDAILKDMAAYAAVHMPGFTWGVNEGFRSAAYQNSLWQKGRDENGHVIDKKKVVTERDGYRRESNHQSSLAADLVPKNAKGWTWAVEDEHWAYLGHCARAYGLTWGGDWKTLRDRPHMEWSEGDRKTYAAARDWQKAQGLR